MAQVTVILQSTLSDWKTTAQAAINANFTEVYAVTDKIDAATTPNPGDVLTWNTGIGQYEPQAPSSGGINDGDTLSTGLTFPNTGLHILDTDASHDLILKHGSNLTADRTLTITTGDSDRTLTLSGNADISGTNTGDQTSVSGNAGTATTLQTARNINGVSFDGSADIDAFFLTNIYSAIGGTGKSISMNGGLPMTNSAGGMTNRQATFQAVWLPKAATITGVTWVQGAAGDYTANHYNGVGLYTISGGTLTLVASSTDDGDIWKATANIWASKAFSSTYNASAGLYFIGALWCRTAQVTAPSIYRCGAVSNPPSSFTQDFTNSVKLSSVLTAQTSLPASQDMSGLTANSNNFWFQLY